MMLLLLVLSRKLFDQWLAQEPLATGGVHVIRVLGVDPLEEYM